MLQWERRGLGERMTDQHAGIVCRSHRPNRAKGSREGTSSRFILPCGVQSQSLWRLSSLNIHHDFREDGGGEFKAQNNAHAVIKDKTKTHDRAVHGVLHHAVLTAFFVAVKVLSVVLVNRGVVIAETVVYLRESVADAARAGLPCHRRQSAAFPPAGSASAHRRGT